MGLLLFLERVARTVLKTGHQLLLVMRDHEEMSTLHYGNAHTLEKARLQVCARSLTRPNALAALVGDLQLIAVVQYLIGRDDDRLLFYGEQGRRQ